MKKIIISIAAFIFILSGIFIFADDLPPNPANVIFTAKQPKILSLETLTSPTGDYVISVCSSDSEILLKKGSLVDGIDDAGYGIPLNFNSKYIKTGINFSPLPEYQAYSDFIPECFRRVSGAITKNGNILLFNIEGSEGKDNLYCYILKPDWDTYSCSQIDKVKINQSDSCYPLDLSMDVCWHDGYAIFCWEEITESVIFRDHGKYQFCDHTTYTTKYRVAKIDDSGKISFCGTEQTLFSSYDLPDRTTLAIKHDITEESKDYVCFVTYGNNAVLNLVIFTTLCAINNETPEKLDIVFEKKISAFEYQKNDPAMAMYKEKYDDEIFPPAFSIIKQPLTSTFLLCFSYKGNICYTLFDMSSTDPGDWNWMPEKNILPKYSYYNKDQKTGDITALNIPDILNISLIYDPSVSQSQRVVVNFTGYDDLSSSHNFFTINTFSSFYVFSHDSTSSSYEDRNIYRKNNLLEENYKNQKDIKLKDFSVSCYIDINSEIENNVFFTMIMYSPGNSVMKIQLMDTYFWQVLHSIDGWGLVDKNVYFTKNNENVMAIYGDIDIDNVLMLQIYNYDSEEWEWAIISFNESGETVISESTDCKWLHTDKIPKTIEGFKNGNRFEIKIS